MKESIRAIIYGVNPVLLTVLATLCVIVGVLIIAFPQILAWVLGIAVILGGVALFATMLTQDPG